MGTVDLRLLEHQWKNGRIQSGYILGVTYLKGRKGATPDPEKGLQYLRLSARSGYLRSAIYLTFYFAGVWGPKGAARHAAARYWNLIFRQILKMRGNQGDWWAREQFLGHLDALQRGGYSWLYEDLPEQDNLIPAYVKKSRERLRFKEQWKSNFP